MKRQLSCILVLAAVAGVCVWRAFSERPPLSLDAEESLYCLHCVDVVIAARDIQPGARLEPADVRLEKFPASLVPTGAYEHMSQVVGRSAMFRIDAGEVLLADKFAAESSAQQKVYEESLRVQCMAVDGTPDCSHIERQRRQQLQQELKKRYPDLARQLELQDRLKKHFERPPSKETLKSAHVRSI